MSPNLPQDDKQARKEALEKIALNRQAQLQQEREMRERRAGDEAARNIRQEEEVKKQEALEAEGLEARHEFTLDQRHKRFAQDEERKKKLAEQKAEEEKKLVKEKEEEEKKQYMGELHDKSVRKKIAARRESIQNEEEESLKIINNREHEDSRIEDEELKHKLDHLQKEAKQASAKAAADRDRAKVAAEDKRRQELSSLKQETFQIEQRARQAKEPERTKALAAERTRFSSRQMQIERDFKAACNFADTQWKDGEQERKFEFLKRIEEAKRESAQAQKHTSQIAEEKRNEAAVRRVGEEQWLLGKE